MKRREQLSDFSHLLIPERLIRDYWGDYKQAGDDPGDGSEIAAVTHALVLRDRHNAAREQWARANGLSEWREVYKSGLFRKSLEHHRGLRR